MGAPLDDITFHIHSPYANNSPEYREQTSLQNFVGDLYLQKMRGYKPPHTGRINLLSSNPVTTYSFWKIGSIVSILIDFNRDLYESLDEYGRCRYLLDIIQTAMFQLTEAYNWDWSVFERAYQEILDSNFAFKLDTPSKKSRDGKKAGWLSIEKTKTVTTVYAHVQYESTILKVRLLEKENGWWYDYAYLLAKHAKWKDGERFGVFYVEGALEIYYSLAHNRLFLLQEGEEVQAIDYEKLSRRVPRVHL
ncbi:hypothetical protein SAMN04488128_103339 [Chitinophaga eiseniae]|uniref:Uncharacterized protein n=1 Tax=Chitinophaga eiseniae TaxID=634771 RepID=A0A1T4SR28_9BACT|nr:hypothetical protein [Chitinophaga eiseniae]SKA30714.1 hypothetical protein SAMN04488128_103339 [Chitinophaga eiseniae]